MSKISFLFFGTLFFLLIPPQISVAGYRNLKASTSSQKRQNRIADKHNLSRIKDRRQLRHFIHKKRLILIEDTSAYYLDEFLGMLDKDHVELYRHARPWVKSFLDDVLSEGYRKFGTRFKVTSLVRTRTYQKKLVRSGANAIGGRAWWQQSSHLTGSTVDISHKDLDPEVREWLAKRLSRVERLGLVEATMERRSACFHVMVHPKYEKRRKQMKRKRKKRKTTRE